MGLKESTLHWPPFVIEVQQRQSEDKISMLVYTDSGNAILALASNGPIYNRGGHELTMARVVRTEKLRVREAGELQ
ncbi:hypothetical protein ABKV19_005014 [Rosa sericea]